MHLLHPDTGNLHWAYLATRHLLYSFLVGPTRIPSRNGSKPCSPCSSLQQPSNRSGPHQTLCWDKAHAMTNSSSFLSTSSLSFIFIYFYSFTSFLLLSGNLLFLLNFFLITPQPPVPQTLQTAIVLSVSMSLTTLYTLYKWNRTVFVFL